MASYEVIFKRSAEKDLRDLPKGTVKRVLTRIEELQRDPRPRQSSKLTGAEQLYRVRVGDYRIIYGVADDEREITVYYVRHRRDAYRQL